MNKRTTNILVNREKNLEKMRDLLDNLEKGDGKTVFIQGEPGVGKTTFIRQIKNEGKNRDFKIMEGRCVSGINKPYLPIREAWTSGKKESLPTLTQIENLQDIELKDRDMLEAHKNAAFYETAEVLKKDIEKVPHVFIIEDMHDADRGTLNLFHYLSDRLSDHASLFIGTYRPGDVIPGDEFTNMKNQMSRKDLYIDIKLQPFSFKNSKKMVQRLLGCKNIPEKFLKLLQKKTKGNPLFIRISLRNMLEQGLISPWEGKFPDEDEFIIPDLLQDVIKQRISRLSKEARSLIQLGSVIGDKIFFPLLANSSELEELEILDHVDDLIESNLWEECEYEEYLYFSHETIRKTVYEGIGKWAERQRLHLRVAETIEKINNDELEKPYVSLAEHYLSGEDYEKAMEYYLKAAENARISFAHEDALQIYDIVLDILSNFDRDIDKIRKLEILKDMADTHRILGNFEESRGILQKAIPLVEDFEYEQRVYIEIITTLQEQGEYEKALELINNRLSLEDEGTLDQGKLLGKKGWSLMKIGHLEEAYKAFKMSKRIAEDIGDKVFLAQSLHNIGSAAFALRDFEDSIKNLEKARKLREEIEDMRELSATMNNLASVYSLNGNLEKAIEIYNECLDAYDQMGYKSKQAQILNNLGVVYKKKGELEKSLDQINKGLKLSQKVGNRFEESQLLTNKGDIYIEMEEFDKARITLDESKSILDQIGCLQVKIEQEYLMGKLEVHEGNIDKANDRLGDLRFLITKRDIERDTGLVKHLNGLIERENKNLEKAKNLLEQSIDIFEKTESFDQKAISLFDLGQVLKNKGDEQNQELIKEASSHFQKRGMDLWKKRCERLLAN